MRQSIKDLSYFQNIKKELENGISNREENLIKNIIPPQRIKRVNVALAHSYFQLIICKYTMGEEIVVDHSTILKIANLILENYDQETARYEYKGKVLNQFTSSSYIGILNFLSYCILIKNKEATKIIFECIKKNGVVDILYETLKNGDFISPINESYKEILFIPNDYKTLRNAIINYSTSDQAENLKKYLSKDWFKIPELKKIDSPCASYVGYWSFEVAALVACLNIDDSLFRNEMVYPKDLVDFYRDQH